MYLNKKRKLSSEEKAQLKLIENALNNLDNILTEEYSVVQKMAKEKFGDNPYNFFEKPDEYTKFEDQINEFINDNLSDKYKKSLEEYKKLKEEKSDYYQYEELGYWRKHADLNNYFSELYYERGGKDEFNCKDLILSKEDCKKILQLAKNILDGKQVIQKGVGFFWGETQESDWKDTIEIFEKALETDFDHYDVVYSCWW